MGVGKGKTMAANGCSGGGTLPPHARFPKAPSAAGKEDAAGPTTRDCLGATALETAISLWGRWRKKSHQGISSQCYSHKLNPAHSTVPGKVLFAMGYSQAPLPKLGRC